MKQLIAIASWLALGSGVAFAAGEGDTKSFNDLDKNKDGVVTQSEASADSKLIAYFDAADTDRNGFLTPSEFNDIQKEMEDAE